MRRRELIPLLGSFAAWPFAASAQQISKIHRVALIFSTSPIFEMVGPEPVHPLARAFLHGLRDLGYAEGRNLILERAKVPRAGFLARNWASTLRLPEAVRQGRFGIAALLLLVASTSGSFANWQKCVSQGDPDLRIAACTQVLEKDSVYRMHAHMVRGNLYLTRGKVDLAQQDFRQVLQLPATENVHRKWQDYASSILNDIALAKLGSSPKLKDPDPDPALNETITRLPVSVKLPDGRTHKGEFVLTTFKPDGPGPFPAVIASHGHSTVTRTLMGRSRMMGPNLVRKGFAVLAPTRVGHGVSTIPDNPEAPRGGGCDQRDYRTAAEAGLAHIRASITYARAQPWIDKDNLILLGGSAGGFYSLVAGGTRPAGVKAVVNFAGGMGGQVSPPGQPCNPMNVAALLSAAGKNNRIPTIWFYSENDTLLPPAVARTWHAAYVRAGGKAEFHMLPPLGVEGHNIIDQGERHWMPLLDRFLASNGFKPK